MASQIAAIVAIVAAAVAVTGYMRGIQAQIAELQERVGITQALIGELPLPYRRLPAGSLMIRQTMGEGCPDDWESVDFTAGDGSIIRPCVKPF